MLTQDPCCSGQGYRGGGRSNNSHPGSIFLICTLSHVLSYGPANSAFHVGRSFSVSRCCHKYYKVVRSGRRPVEIILGTCGNNPSCLHALPVRRSRHRLIRLGRSRTSCFRLAIHPAFSLCRSLLTRTSRVRILRPTSMHGRVHGFTGGLVSCCGRRER